MFFFKQEKSRTYQHKIWIPLLNSQKYNIAEEYLFSSLDKKVFCYEHLIYPLSILVKNIVIRRKNSLMLEYILFSLLSFFFKIFSMYCIKSDSIANTISKKKSFVNTLNIFNPLQVKRSYCYYDDQRANTKWTMMKTHFHNVIVNQIRFLS